MLEKPGKPGMVGEEGAVDLVPVQVDQVPGGVGHLVPVARDSWPCPHRAAARRSGARTAPGSRCSRRARPAARRGPRWGSGVVCPNFTPGGVGAERVALGAVHRDAHVVGGLGVLEGVGVGGELLILGRVGAEHLGDVDRGVLEFLVHRGHVADVAAGPGERHPGRRGGGVRLGRGRGGGRRGGRVHHGRVGVVARRSASWRCRRSGRSSRRTNSPGRWCRRCCTPGRSC